MSLLSSPPLFPWHALDVIQMMGRCFLVFLPVDLFVPLIHRFEIINADAPVAFSPVVLSAISSAATELNLSQMPMVSRAYHDAPFMAK